MRAILLLAFAAQGFAHEPLHIDLSGEWRMIIGDMPEYASPEFDDSGWETIKLPLGRKHNQKEHWLRRRAELPADTDRTRLALTLGTIQNVYEVYINGLKIGGSGNYDAIEQNPIAHGRTFFIPAQSSSEAKPLVIALRIKYAMWLVPAWILPDDGPYLLTYREQAPTEAGALQQDKYWRMYSPSLFFAAIFLTLGVLAVSAWRSDKERRELLWFALVSVQYFVTAVYITSHLRGVHYVADQLGQSSVQALIDLVIAPMFGMLVINALGFRSRWLRAALWLGWSLMLLPLLIQADNSLMRIGNLWSAALPLFLILWDWRRLISRKGSAEEHMLRFVLMLPVLSNTEYWATQLAGMPDYFQNWWNFGGFLVARDDIFWLAVSVTILTLLVRRLRADRLDRQRLASELSAARNIQQTLLAHSNFAGAPVEAVYEPANEVGGDFYQVLATNDGGHLVLLGDVSGKGLNAAMLVSVVMGASRGNTHPSPAAMLAGLNTALTGYTAGGFVTCCCALLHADGRLTLANAGHLPPYWNGREVVLEAGLPLGIVPDVEYAETTIQLAPGDQVTLLSDGVVEAADKQGELFGFARTAAISSKPAREIADAAKAWGQNDDITVVTVKRKNS